MIFLHGDWGLGIGDWGLGIGDWDQSSMPNSQLTNRNTLSHFKKNIGLKKKNFILFLI